MSGIPDFDLSVAAGPWAQPTSTEELPTLDGSYARLVAQVALTTRFGKEFPSFMKDSGVRLGLEYVHISGDEGNMGSHVNKWGVVAGWKQHISQFFYAEGLFGLGGADNRLNFGRGFPLRSEGTFNGEVQVFGGAELCIGSTFCPSVFAGYYHEATLVGKLGYTDQGAIFGLRGTFKPDAVVPNTPSTDSNIPLVDPTKNKEATVKPKIVEVEVEKPTVVEVEVDPPLEKTFLLMPYVFGNMQTRNILQMDLTPGGSVRHRRDGQLEKVAAYLIKYPKIKVFLHGYANQMGSETELENNAHSLLRVLWVQSYLVQNGKIDLDRIIIDAEYSSVGKNDWKPIRTYKNFEKLRANSPNVSAYSLNWRGKSVHGDGRGHGDKNIFPDDQYQRLPFPDNPADIANRCVRFQILKDEEKKP